MIGWFKGAGSAIAAAVVLLFAFMAVAKAARERDLKEKWQKQAIDDTGARVVDDIDETNASLQRAQQHEKNAERADQDGQKRMDKIKNSNMADLVSSWTKP